MGNKIFGQHKCSLSIFMVVCKSVVSYYQSGNSQGILIYVLGMNPAIVRRV